MVDHGSRISKLSTRMALWLDSHLSESPPFVAQVGGLVLTGTALYHLSVDGTPLSAPQGKLVAVSGRVSLSLIDTVGLLALSLIGIWVVVGIHRSRWGPRSFITLTLLPLIASALYCSFLILWVNDGVLPYLWIVRLSGIATLLFLSAVLLSIEF